MLEYALILGGVIIACQFFVELVRIVIGLENHQYINNSYKHSIQHFAYISLYFTGVLLLLTGKIVWSVIFFMVGTIVLNYHIRQERLNKV